MTVPTLLDLLRCPVCRCRVEEHGHEAACRGCGASFPVEDGMPRMLDDRLPGIEAKRREIEGWPAMARAHGWYELDDEVDAHLPYLNRDLGWDDKNWRATEHSFSLLLDRYVAARHARARGGGGESVGVAASRSPRLRVRGDGHPRRPGHRARPRGVLRGAGRRVRPCPGRRRAPAVRRRRRSTSRTALLRSITRST